MNKYLVVFLTIIALMAVMLPASVMAAGNNGEITSDVNDPPIVIGADWSATTTVPPAFLWSGTIPVTSSSGPFTFTSTGVVRVDVTDDFQKGDQFNVYDNAGFVGTTSLVAVDATSLEVGPEVAFNDATYSSGSFILGPGDHSIDIEVIGASFTIGRGYIRVVQLVEFTKEIIATTEAGDGDGVVETGEDWQWTMRIELENVSGETITVDKVHDRLGGDIESHDVDFDLAMGALDWYTKGNTDKEFFNWYDGFTLADGEGIWVELIVSPDVNTGHGNGKKAAGHQEFTSPGVHCLNSGASFEGYIGDDFISASTLPVCVDVEEFVDNSGPG
ncbi:hypothetical protein ACFLTP_05390 [Chloroflexota bacterium]